MAGWVGKHKAARSLLLLRPHTCVFEHKPGAFYQTKKSRKTSFLISLPSQTGKFHSISNKLSGLYMMEDIFQNLRSHPVWISPFSETSSSISPCHIVNCSLFGPGPMSTCRRFIDPVFSLWGGIYAKIISTHPVELLKSVPRAHFP